jgi:hypothetical protein
MSGFVMINLMFKCVLILKERDCVAKQWEAAWHESDKECTSLRQEVASLRASLESSTLRERAERAGRLAAEEGRSQFEERQNTELDRLRSRCLAEAECHQRAAEEVVIVQQLNFPRNIDTTLFFQACRSSEQLREQKEEATRMLVETEECKSSLRWEKARCSLHVFSRNDELSDRNVPNVRIFRICCT